MRAVVYDRYGPPSVLRVEDVAVPQPGPGEVLVEVVAVSVNLSDWETLHGSPAYSRIGGLRRPARRILGSDIAGRVSALGPGVTAFSVGDAVYGDILQRKGGFAEYALAGVREIAPIPAGLSFAQAAALPQAAAIAAHGAALAAPGARMLINGAGGGSGALMIQLAVRAGARVTGVDNAGKQEFMRSVGAAATLDYRATDATRTGPYDVVVDLVATRSMFAYRRMLAPGGRFVMVGGTTRALLRAVTVGAVLGALSGRRLGMLAVHEGPASFAPVAQDVARGALQIPIDRTFTLEETAAALAHHGEGRAHGKVVVAVRDA